MMPHVTGHVISPTSHVTASHKPSHSGSLLEPAGGDGSHGDELHALSRHKLVEPACPHTDSLFHENLSAGIVRGTSVNDEGVPLPSSSLCSDSPRPMGVH